MSAFESNPGFGRLRHLIDAHKLGHYDLPPELVDAWNHAETLNAERLRPTPQLVGPARDRLVDDFLNAGAGRFPDGAELLDAELAERRDAMRLVALSRATTIAQGDFVELVTDLADQLVTGPLRDALAEVVAQATKAVATMAQHRGQGDSKLLSAPKAVRDASVALEALAARYGELREARRDLVPTAARPEYDDERLFGEIKNLLTIWPNAQRRGAPPWPTDSGKARLIWLIDHGAVLWMATADEVKAHYETVFADELAAQKHAAGVRARVGEWSASRQ
jgi:hypothetical protein